MRIVGNYKRLGDSFCGQICALNLSPAFTGPITIYPLFKNTFIQYCKPGNS